MNLNIELNSNADECDEEWDVLKDGDGNFTDVEENEILEPCIGMEFVSHEEARSYYLTYAKFVGFGASIKHSRRSRASGEFIDVSFACTSYIYEFKGTLPAGILNPEMEKIGQAFLGLKSKAEDFLSYLSNVTTKCLDDARRFFHNFTEGFKEKLVRSKRFMEETISKVAGILRNFPKNIVTYLVKVLATLMLKMLKLMFNLGKSELQRRFAEILCKVNHLYALVEGFLGLVPPSEPVSAVILVMEAVVHMTVSEINAFMNFPEGGKKAVVFANSNEVF